MSNRKLNKHRILFAAIVMLATTFNCLAPGGSGSEWEPNSWDYSWFMCVTGGYLWLSVMWWNEAVNVKEQYAMFWFMIQRAGVFIFEFPFTVTYLQRLETMMPFISITCFISTISFFLILKRVKEDENNNLVIQ